MLKNNIFKLYFDYRGTLGSREYKAGLVFMLILLIFRLIGYYFYSASNTIFFRLNDTDNFIDISLANSIINRFFLISVPYSIIALYCSIVISCKRCKLLNRKKYVGVLAGIILYLLFELIFFIVSNEYTTISSFLALFKTFWKTTLSCIALIFLFNIIYIIELSKRNNNDIEYIESKYNTTNTLFCIGKIVLYLLLAYITTSALFVILSDIKSSEDISLYGNIVNLINIIAFIVFVLVLEKRATDAGVKSNAIFVLLCCSFILFFIIIVVPSLYDNFLYSQPFIYKALSFVSYYINIITFIGIFNLIGLPTKQRKEEF